MGHRIFKQIDKSNLTWLRSNLVFLTRHGSHAYGTNIASSDEDFKGFVIAPEQYYLGYHDIFEQAIWSKPDEDMCLYDIRKFFSLAAQCNPSIIEVLFTDQSDWIYTHTWFDRYILPQRDLFLSRRARHTFSGYATSQLKRIEGHNRWLRNPPKAPPTRAEFDLPENSVVPRNQLEAAQAMIDKRIAGWGLDFKDLDEGVKINLQSRISETLTEMVAGGDDAVFHRVARNMGFDDNFLELLDKERLYRRAKNNWRSYQEWKAKRNPQRAELEAKWGMDTKHAMHLVRLMRMCREILETGKVIVKRPDREELLEIRDGKWTYEELVDWAKKEDKAMEAVEAASPLPRVPDHKKLSDLCCYIVGKSFLASV